MVSNPQQELCWHRRSKSIEHEETENAAKVLVEGVI